MLSWVIGAGGLLGGSVSAAVGECWRPASPVPWGEPHAGSVLTRMLGEFRTAARDRPWQVLWCAGAAVTGSTAADLEREAATFASFAEALAAGPPERGALFVASSAGGVYSGSTGAPYDERTEPRAISAYGEAKLALEQRARSLGEAGLPVLIGRIANLYGPGQDLTKPQGLISQLVLAHLRNEPISIYVPLDTVRDYLFAPDAGALIADAMDRLRAEPAGAYVKVLATQQGVTIGQLVAELRRLTKRRPLVVYGSAAESRYQARDLRLRSVVWAELDRRTLTTLPAGMQRTLLGQLRALQHARLGA